MAWAINALWPTVSYQRMSETKKEELRESGKLQKIESKIIKQGLDLKGGMYIVLEVDLPTLITGLAINKDQNLERVLNKVRDRMNEPDADFFNLLTNTAEEEEVRLARYFHEFGASSDEIIGKLRDESDDAINRVLEILQNRVDQFGVSEPTIQKQGSQRIIVELAGIQDSDRARGLLQSTALLEFYLVKDAEITQDVLIRIDNKLKGKEDVVDLTEDPTADESVEEPTPSTEKQVAEDKTISVSELFGETTQDTPTDNRDTSGAVVDERLFKDSPFRSLLRDFGTDIGVPEANVYAVNKFLALTEIQDILAATSGQFALSH